MENRHHTELENLRRKSVWDLVAKGYIRKKGRTLHTHFCPDSYFHLDESSSTIAGKNQWPVYNFDFVAAYLNAPIDEEVWVEAPEGLEAANGEACLLQRALYGTKQAARSLKQLESELKGSLEIKWNEGLTSMVGVKIKRTSAGFELTQPNLIDKVLQERWDGVSINTTPLPEGYSAFSTVGYSGINSTDYLSAIGSLSYVSVGTRPDISYSVNYLARFSKNPSSEHWKGLNHLLGYLAGTKEVSLKLHPRSSDEKPVECYCDANWGGTTSRSTYGVFIRLYGSPIMWVSRRLVTVASSTCQAEYMALGHATRHALWIRNLLCDIIGVNFKVNILCDNQSAVKIGCEDASNKRTHHIERVLCFRQNFHIQFDERVLAANGNGYPPIVDPAVEDPPPANNAVTDNNPNEEEAVVLPESMDIDEDGEWTNVVHKSKVLATRMKIRRKFLGYFEAIASMPSHHRTNGQNYRMIVRRKLYHNIMLEMDCLLAAVVSLTGTIRLAALDQKLFLSQTVYDKHKYTYAALNRGAVADNFQKINAKSPAATKQQETVVKTNPGRIKKDEIWHNVSLTEQEQEFLSEYVDGFPRTEKDLDKTVPEGSESVADIYSKMANSEDSRTDKEIIQDQNETISKLIQEMKEFKDSYQEMSRMFKEHSVAPQNVPIPATPNPRVIPSLRFATSTPRGERTYAMDTTIGAGDQSFVGTEVPSPDAEQSSPRPEIKLIEESTGVILDVKKTNLYFDGTDVELFLKRVEKTAKIHGAGAPDVAEQLPFILNNRKISEAMEQMEGHETANWELFKKELIRKWGRATPLRRYKEDAIPRLIQKTQENQGIKNHTEYKNLWAS
ncbi:hypothetical protein PSHT_14879 [Puccinia striiformis]|uniref:Reverse transcriptase Ty1/copia-type domain-containing protein n=1 Tax=Puccinia striiformis TaxID=27350 RepID=A0A2S4UI12_9BASI|nr:hypothetical protein PSHT_14879 [Puccinia striiformis]